CTGGNRREGRRGRILRRAAPGYARVDEPTKGDKHSPPRRRGGADQGRREENVPLSGGMSRLNEPFDPGPPPREFLLRLPVVDGHPAQEIGPAGLRVHAPDVVLVPLRPSVRALGVSEVEFPPPLEVANTSSASD